MNFGSHHYVPVLKVKRGEKAALQLLAPSVQQTITPLLEIVERTGKTLDAHLETTFRGLANAVNGLGRCFIDARELAPDGPGAAVEVFRRAASEGIPFTPVTGLSGRADVRGALEHGARGLALRLRREEFEAGNLSTNIRTFLDRVGLAPIDIDMIIDLGPVENMVAEGVEDLSEAFLNEVPDHELWNTLTLSASAFPLSMGGVGRFSYDTVERADWIAWRDGLHARRKMLRRLPTFSDCAIQHPRGVEGFDPRLMQISASVRYIVEDEWLLLKGESTRRTPPSMQFPALAKVLVNGSLRRYYRGSDHCSGCEGIMDAANDIGGFGSPEVWRRLGTVHHITTVVQDLNELPWP